MFAAAVPLKGVNNSQESSDEAVQSSSVPPEDVNVTVCGSLNPPAPHASETDVGDKFIVMPGADPETFKVRDFGEAVTGWLSVRLTLNVWLCTVVGVPEMFPEEVKDNPFGKTPESNDHEYGVFPPIPTRLTL